MARRFVLLPLFFLTCVGFWGMHRDFPWPYPPFNQLMTQRHGLEDVGLVTAGFRCLAADLAWIQLLQYVGGSWLPGEDTHRAFAELKTMTLRTTRLDPYFRHAYSYSASMLAFFKNINRPDEALDVLVEGMHANPTYWPFRATAAAIGYLKADQFDRMAQTLEDTIQHPECPVLVKSVLANGYKTHGRTADAIRVWKAILADPQGVNYYEKARREIAAAQKAGQ